tara:strand:+ start:2567 stop:3985 length:1419 start_codon:yes stop_codon:yes gene_type:complete
MNNLKHYILDLTKFAQKRFGFERPPKMFLKTDEENAKNIFGKTAHYDPQEESVTLYISMRHPKDVLRSLSHELVHHTQNLRGDLSPEKCGNLGPGYAQDNKHMREMEREAYEKGSLCFRDYEDKCKKNLEENANKALKENKEMSSTLTKNALKSVITRFLNESQVEETQTTPESTEEEVVTENSVKMAALKQKKMTRAIGDGVTNPKAVIKELQEFLNELLEISLPVDGIYGRDTMRAIMLYQKKNGIKQDGVVGPQTYKKMKAQLDMRGTLDETTCSTRDKDQDLSEDEGLEEELEQEGIGKVASAFAGPIKKAIGKLSSKKGTKYTAKTAAKVASSDSKVPTSEVKFIHEQEMIDEVEGLSEQEKADLEEIVQLQKAVKKISKMRPGMKKAGEAGEKMKKAGEAGEKAEKNKGSEKPMTEGTCGTCNESKENCVCPTNEAINTPEKENALYESRFNKRNELLFEKLMSKF